MRAADDHPCSDPETSHDGIADRTGSVVEVDVDALRAGGIECCLEIVSLVVHGSVVAEVLATHAHFLGPTGDADGAAPLDLGDLADA